MRCKESGVGWKSQRGAGGLRGPCSALPQHPRPRSLAPCDGNHQTHAKLADLYLLICFLGPEGAIAFSNSPEE